MTNNIPEADELQRFNTLLDRIALGGEFPSAELEPTIAEIAAVLSTPASVNLSRRRDQMRARVLGYNAVLRRQRVLRLAASAAVIVLTAVVSYLVINQPSTFALQPEATVVYGEIGGCLITNGEGWAHRMATNAAAGTPLPWERTPEPGATQRPMSVGGVYSDPIRASKAVGYDVWVPQYVPSDMDNLGYIVQPEVAGRVGSQFGKRDSDSIQPIYPYSNSIYLEQRILEPNSDCVTGVKDALVTVVSVHRHPAYWIDNNPVSFSREKGFGYIDQLMWEEAGYLFTIHAENLDLSDAHAIAESMMPYHQIQP